MKKYSIILAALLTAMAAVSCDYELVFTPTEKGDPVPEGFKRVAVNAVQGADTKTAYDADVTFSWTSGDAISVYCVDATEPSNTGFYTFSTTDSGPSATFSADIPATAEIGDVALFPASAGHTYAGGTYKFNVDADKSLIAHDSADIPMYGAKDGSGNFAFTHLAGAFKFNVSNIPAGVSAVKVSFTAATSKMSGLFDITGSGPYSWGTAAGANAAARTISRECAVSENAVTVYLPYTTGTVWGSSTITVEDYTGGAVGSVLYTNDAVGAIPVTRKKVTRLGTLSCEYVSAYGIDWSSIASATVAAENTYPALQTLKATMDAYYFYVYLEARTTAMVLNPDHDHDHCINIYLGSASGSNDYWGGDVYTALKAYINEEIKDTNGWASTDGVPAFSLSSNRSFSSHVSTVQNVAYYELRIPRDAKIYAALAQTSEDIKLGVVLDDVYYDDAYKNLNSHTPYGIIPARGTSMYVVPQYVEPTPSSTVATASSVSRTYHESLTETVNPERGMYRHNEYHFTGGTVNKTSVTCESDLSLALLIFYLEDFMTSENLTPSAITSIRTILGNVRAAGKKAIVRFAYNDTRQIKVSSDPDEYEDVNPREPETLSYITNHIDDLEDVFNEYKDVIYLVQAGFLGTYGEWYYTTETGTPLFPRPVTAKNFSNRATVLAEILTKVPNTIQVALRTPFYKRFYLNPATPDSWSTIPSWDGTDANSRLTFHNDAFLASEEDMGTFKYTPDKPMWKGQSGKLAIGGEVAFISLASADPAYYALEPALQAIADYNYSYLNDASANDEIIQYWVTNDQYPIIRKALGYRLVLNNLSITPAGTYASGQSVNFSIRISNTGSASVIYPRPCKLVLLHGSTPTVLKDLTAAHDVRDITPGSNYTYSFDLILPQNICEGDRLAIWMPDKTAGLQTTEAYSIRLSNSDVSWNNGYNVIHTF